VPADIGADNVAVAVLGMRLGYLHYSDWTSLPAPLFFKRKIDDYVISLPLVDKAQPQTMQRIR